MTLVEGDSHSLTPGSRDWYKAINPLSGQTRDVIAGHMHAGAVRVFEDANLVDFVEEHLRVSRPKRPIEKPVDRVSELGAMIMGSIAGNVGLDMNSQLYYAVAAKWYLAVLEGHARRNQTDRERY